VIIEERDDGLWADILWDDLSVEAQTELLDLMGDNGNYDVFPLTSINISRNDGESVAP
jgi:hypothetical protein